jgi:hypothetical protein
MKQQSVHTVDIYDFPKKMGDFVILSPRIQRAARVLVTPKAALTTEVYRRDHQDG